MACLRRVVYYPQEARRFAGGFKLTRHLVCDRAAGAVGEQVIGAMRPMAAQYLDVERRHRFHVIRRPRHAVQARGLDAIYRLVFTYLSHQVVVLEQRP